MTDKTSSWEPVSEWYDKAVGNKGHYYHENIVLPKTMQLLDLQKDEKQSLLDLACGQGVLSRHLGKEVAYEGVDISSSLIQSAHRQKKHPHHKFHVADLNQPLSLKKKDFSHAVILLALQNIAKGHVAIQSAYDHLDKGGKLLIALNHPCFRIPRQSSWGIDEKNNIQYRRMDRYFSSMEIPILAHPSQKEKSSTSLTYHHSLSTYFLWLKKAGFLVEVLEEWCSDKKSTGKQAKREDRSRKEFPLFLAIVAVKGP